MNHPSAGVWSANGFFCHITDETGERSVKLLHLSDLHLGKRLNGFSLWEDQKYLLRQILEITEQEAPDCVVIAGDLYDKSVPPEEAVGLLDWFLVGLSCRCAAVFLISGNHDSPGRLAFGRQLLEKGGVYVAGEYDGTVAQYALTDAFGTVRLFLLPFIKPVRVRKALGVEAETSEQAMSAVLSRLTLEPGERNVLVAHQFVTGAIPSESEEVVIGGTDGISAELFAPFDYTALGHIHRSQWVGSERVRYCGSPLAYSFSEGDQVKSVTVVELREKGQVTVWETALPPLRRMTTLRGRYEELTAKAFYEGASYQSDYIRAILTDEEDVVDAAAKLRIIYPNLMKLEYDNLRTSRAEELTFEERPEEKSPLDLLEELYRQQNNQEMSREQRELAQRLMQEIREVEA